MEKRFNIKVGIIGNPGVGKSSLFTLLTGKRQNVGTTVEKRECELSFDGNLMQVVDLPGAYSLNAYNKEEAIASDFIFGEKPDAIIQIIDAQNLERNLLMTVQLLEMDAPLILALNLLDLAERRGIFINTEKLSALLGAPVVAINVKKKRGMENLLSAILKKRARGKTNKRKIFYGEEVEEELEKIKRILAYDVSIPSSERNWLGIKIIEGDEKILDLLKNKDYYGRIQQVREKSIVHLETIFAKDIEMILARIRYGFIEGLARECIEEKKGVKVEKNFSEKLDEIALNRFTGVPLFLMVIFAVFQLAFKAARPFSIIMEKFFYGISEYVNAIMTGLGFSKWTISLISDGILGGVGSVLIFVPTLGILFALIAILEDSGYMARIAYVMDRFMHKLGLHGKAFIPMVLGFGCNVPGIMATRTLETKRDRLLAILMNPFMSCGSRLPTYILFAGIFFVGSESAVIISLYILGMFVAVIVAFILRKLFFRQMSSPFVIELPAYRIPNFKGVIIHTGERVWAFIKNAGTLIMTFSVVIWLMANLPFGVAYGSEESLAGIFGQLLSPFFVPLGFGNWQASVALLFGLAGKEIIIGAFGALYGGGNADSLVLASSLRNDFTPLSAYSFLVFVLLYTPCIATLATIKKETGSWKWTIFVALYSVVIAWLAAFAVYNGGKLLGF